MNKQELIEKLTEYVNRYEAVTDEYYQGRHGAYGVALKLVKQLDEPQKPVVPKFVADWFEQHKDKLGYSIWELVGASHKSYTTNKLDMRHWVCQERNEPFETLIRMKNGYEVEKEQLYYVKFPDLRHSSSDNVYGLKKTLNGEIRVSVFDKQEIGKIKDSQLTKQEIKAIDERYWAFAVPVEEVVEG